MQTDAWMDEWVDFFLLALLLLLILGAGGYGTYAYLFHMWPFTLDEEQPAQLIGATTGNVPDVSDQYIRFDTAFTFNLPDPKSKRGHMVQAEVVLVAKGTNNANLAQQNLPLISATISEICAQQQYDVLASASGRERFKRLLLDGIRTKLTGLTGQPLIEQVLFINFVMQ